jgi:hypothetical protein
MRTRRVYATQADRRPRRSDPRDPVQKATVYAGVSQQGAFLSRDEGATWQPLGEGLPLSGFGGKLALARDAHRHLYAATFATGAWALDLP